MYSFRMVLSVSAGCLISLALTPLGANAAVATGAGPARPGTLIVQPIDESQRIELKGHIHRAIYVSEDLGEADPKARAERIIMLLRGKTTQEADLKQFLIDVQTRGKPEYHHWLTPEAFARRFGAAPADLSAVRAWLKSKGFSIDEEPAGSRSLVFSGTIAEVTEAFATRIHRYRWHAEEHIANATNPSIPKALAGVIARFASLNDFRHRPQWIRSLAKPQFTSGSNHFLAPGDFATIYDLTSPYAQEITGSGKKIAVIGRSDVAAGDLSNFRSTFGLSSSMPQMIVNGPDPGFVHEDELESDLDLEWAGAVAPSASVIFVTSKSTSMTDGIDLSSQYAVSHDIADVITVSYGSCESASDLSGGTTLYNQLWQQAAAQGTSVFVSSGDSGAAGCDPATASTATQGLGVNLLCSSPYSTCVGGTEFSADVAAPSTYWSSSNTPGSQASALGYIGEAVWNQSGANLYASGGGASVYYAKPAWQLSPGVPSDGRRDVPDVALNAASNHDAYFIYTSDGFSSSTLVGIGGTSASAPSMAAMAALVVQHENGRVGNLNPVLYGLSGLQASGGAAVFHLNTSGNNSVPGQAGFSATSSDPIYNQATGLGSIDGAQLLAHWGDFAGTVFGLSPATAVVQADAVVGSATLTLPVATAWAAVVGGGGAGWLSVTPPSGTGSAPLSFATTANPSPSARSGTITIAGQLLTVTQAAASGGNNTGQVSLSSSTVAFGNDALGVPTSGQRVLVSDTGNASLTLGAITLSGGGSGDFSDSGSCAAGLVLGPGASCYLDVTFDPTAIGARSATLQIGLNGGGSTSVALSGIGDPATGISDAPLPLWAYGLLGLLFLATAAHRQRRNRARVV
jgi:pseudomonalisin